MQLTSPADSFSQSSDSSLVEGNQSQNHTFNRTLLQELNDQMLVTLLPAVVYLAILMLVGTVGNSMALYVFGRRLKSTTQNLLFLWLAVFDLLTCVVGIPSEIADIRHYYLYEDVVACKMMRFLLTVPAIASVNLLLIIAVDRYRRVCRPLHWQLAQSKVKWCVVTSAVLGVVVAGPAFSLYGRRTIQTGVAGLSGCDCSVQDKYQGRLYPLLYEMIFGVAFIVYTIALSVMYVRVWLEIRRHRKYMRRHSITSVAMTSLLRGEADSDSLPSAVTDDPDLSRTKPRDLNSVTTESPERRRKKPSDLSMKILKSLRASKLTVIALTVTLVFVMSYLPHLCLIITRTVVEDFDRRQSGAGLVVYNIFLRSYFLNSVANVFIYSAMNAEFRTECRAVLLALWPCHRKDNAV